MSLHLGLSLSLTDSSICRSDAGPCPRLQPSPISLSLSVLLVLTSSRFSRVVDVEASLYALPTHPYTIYNARGPNRRTRSTRTGTYARDIHRQQPSLYQHPAGLQPNIPPHEYCSNIKINTRTEPKCG